MPGPVVSVRALKKSFFSGDSELHVLRGIDIEIAAGEMVAVVGASGVGKSTMLQIIGGLDRPTSGGVYYDNTDIFGLGDTGLARFRNANIGFVFQFHHLLPEFTALENVVIPARIAGEQHDNAAKRAEALLSSVGLSGRLHHRPGELSGGEQQRVAVARALMMSPAILLADEPTGNLDTHTASSVHELLRELNRERGLTMVVVTHNEELARGSDRTIRMVDGQVSS
jgi:lipoprotein-releasing system ATP-binding protein